MKNLSCFSRNFSSRRFIFHVPSREGVAYGFLQILARQELDPELRSNMEEIDKEVKRLPEDDQLIMRRVLDRYNAEALNDNYRTNPDKLVELITDNRLLDDSTELVDLGAGPGDLIRKLAKRYPNVWMRGIDASPGFVTRFNQRRRTPKSSMRVGLIDRPLTSMNLGINASVASILTLDRVMNPRGLIANIGRSTRSRILGTLLPVVPEDDNPSRQEEGTKIIYTPPENRIVPGRSVTGDKEKLLALLREIWGTRLDVAKIPYTVMSSKDKQIYDLWVFYTR